MDLTDAGARVFAQRVLSSGVAIKQSQKALWRCDFVRAIILTVSAVALNALIIILDALIMCALIMDALIGGTLIVNARLPWGVGISRCVAFLIISSCLLLFAQLLENAINRFGPGISL